MADAAHPDRAEIFAIGEGFRARTWPAARFHHREHLIALTYLLIRYPERDWRRELPDAIRAYNIAHGGVNDERNGYHHTITMFFLEAVQRVVAGAASEDYEGAAAAVIASPATDQAAPLRIYSRERLFSPEARREWIAPDLAAIGDAGSMELARR